MSKKNYGKYEYIDPDNQYTYPDSTVLRNKFDITDSGKASQKEYRVVAKKIIRLGVHPIEIQGMADIRQVHRYLFQDMYDWAGDFRRVNISKEGHAFMAMQSFDTGTQYMDELISKFIQTATTKSEIIKQLAEILDNLNYMHPFREGNGRTQREVIRSLALNKGYFAEIDISFDEEVYHLYMDGTVNADLSKLEELFSKILEKA